MSTVTTAMHWQFESEEQSKPQSDEVSHHMVQIIIFALDEELYAVGIDDVWEITPMQEITPVPQAPEYIEGVTNLRGRITPVVNMRKRLGLPSTIPDRHTRLMVIKLHQSRLAIIVDRVQEVAKVPAYAIEQPPELVETANDKYVRGIVKRESDIVVWLDVHCLFGKPFEQDMKDTAS